jgi:GcrA cell cycle regulator
MENYVANSLQEQAEPVPQPRLGRPPSWDKERVALLRELIAKGEPARNIAGHLGVTRNAVIGKAGRLGLSIGGEKKQTRATLKPKDTRQKLTRLVFPVAPVKPVNEPAPDSLNKTLLELRGSDCRYPVTEEIPFLFCGHPQDGDSSYCAHHRQICTMKSTYKRRAA